MGRGEGRGEGSGGMLQAKKSALQATLTQSVVELQNSELTYFYNNFGTISTLAAVLGGFSLSGLIISTRYNGWMMGVGSGVKSTLIVLYYAFAALAIGFCLITAVICTAVNVRGPGLALRGPDGSLAVALEQMRKYQKHVNVCMMAGMLCFHMMAMLYGFVAISRTPGGVTVFVLLMAFLAGLVKYVYDVFRDLRIPDARLVSGGFGQRDFESLEQTASGSAAASEAGSQHSGAGGGYGATRSDAVSDRHSDADLDGGACIAHCEGDEKPAARRASWFANPLGSN